MKAQLCRAANPKGVLMSHSCAAPTIVTHSDDATFNPAAELTTTKLHESILELRTLAAAIETQILEGLASPHAAGRSLKQHVDTLQTALELKQRSVQVLRLRAHFSPANELQLEERQGFGRCVSIRRQLATILTETAVDPASEAVPATRAAETTATRSDGDTQQPDGWGHVAALISEIACELPTLQARMNESFELSLALQRDAAAVDAERSSHEAAELAELLDQVEAAKAELARLREGRAGTGSSRADEIALDKLLGRLQNEASSLLQTKVELEDEVASLRRTLRAVTE